MHFVEFDNTAENFSGSRKLSHLYHSSSECGESRGPCVLSWRSVAGQNLVLAQLDVWNADAVYLATLPQGWARPLYPLLMGISSPGGSQEGIVRACLLSFESIEWKLVLISGGCETCLRSRSICVRGIETLKWALVVSSLWNASVKYPGSPTLIMRWTFSVFSYILLRKPYVELPLNAITDTSLVCFVSNPRRS